MKTRTLLVAIGVLLLLTGCQGQNRGASSNASMGSSGGGGGGPVTLPSGTFVTTPQVMTASTTVKTLTWNLASQIQGTSPVPGGGTFSITVQEVVSTSGEDDYLFGNPTVTGGTSALLVQNVGFEINGAVIPLATVLIGINRMIPASAARVLSTTTQLIPVAAFAATDTVSLTFGNLAPTVFNPPTLTNLKSATGVFGKNCISCHTTGNANGGLDFTNYTTIIDTVLNGTGYFGAVAYDPSDSLIIMAMSNINGIPAMPTAGILPTATTQQVYDWINDGAPNN